MKSITTFLMFVSSQADKAEEAIKFYTLDFAISRVRFGGRD